MTPRAPLIVGNWKMNGLAASAATLDRVVAGLSQRRHAAETLICPPATLLFGFAERALSAAENGVRIAIGAQDCHAEAAGARTGDLSAEMLADAGAVASLVGHSERREGHGETDAMVRQKAQAAIRAGLAAIICLGENAEERAAGRAVDVVVSQLREALPEVAPAEAPSRLAVAYEPVWAIGSGRTPSVAEIEETHAALRQALADRFGEAGRDVRLLYGGSVKHDNAAALLRAANVDGALVGGASLVAADFLAIVDAAPAPQAAA